MLRKWLMILSAAVLAMVLTAPIGHAAEKPRVIVMSDIGTDPDDKESLVRFMLYANEFDVEGLIADTSTWQRNSVHPELMVERIKAYGQVLNNLRVHAAGYPDAASLLVRVRAGRPEYGMLGVGAGKDTGASNEIIAAVDAPDSRPVWVLLWGGATDLAQALWHVRESRSPDQVRAFVAKLRVYSTSDQDDAGPWIRQNFGQLFWAVSIEGFDEYYLATWFGISGDLLAPSGGPDTSLVTNEWLQANIRKGPLGMLYPPHKYIMEGDTPTFLNLISNGLNVPEHPEYGGWGGRYAKLSPAYGLYTDVSDTVTGKDGKLYRNNQATIWRWRPAYQADFAARIGWTLTPVYSAANHAPIALLNGQGGVDPVEITAKPGQAVSLSAAGSRDPNKTALHYRWWVYNEINVPGFRGPAVKLAAGDTPSTSLVAPPGPRAVHVILEVWNSGVPAMVSYRRAIIAVTG